MRRIFITFFLILILLVIKQPALAADILFADDFSDGLNQWEPVRDDGRYWSINNGQLEAYLPNQSTITELVPTNEAWGNITDFDLSFDLTPVQGVDRNISFGFKDLNNWYELHFTAGSTYLVKLVDGDVAWGYETQDLILSNGIQYHLRIHFKQGQVTLVNDGKVIFSEQDPTFNGEYGKIGLKASTGASFPSKVRFDNVVVKEVVDLSQPQPQLSVPLIKQTDSAWASAQYDTASNWIENYEGAEPTMSDWGCNLMAQLMVMQFHGINKLPDGTQLDPLTLNQWLLENDGFINSPYTGLINRKSLTRLTALNTDQYQTPSLEYKYVDTNMASTIVNEIDQGRPAILELAGHFVVAVGYTSNQDIIINDPGYDYTLLSQHELDLKSVRTYTPSFTDLSYVEVISEPSVEVSIRNTAGEVMEDANSYVESLQPLGRADLTQQVQVSEVAQPADNEYLIQAINNEDQTGNISIRSYDDRGQLQFAETKTVAPTSTATWQLDVQNHEVQQIEAVGSSEPAPSEAPQTPTPTVSIEPIAAPQPITFSFNEIRLIVMTLNSEEQVIHPIVSQLLLKMIDLAERWYESPARGILIRIIRRVIEFVPSSIISVETKEELLLLIEVFDNPEVTVTAG